MRQCGKKCFLSKTTSPRERLQAHVQNICFFEARVRPYEKKCTKAVYIWGLPSSSWPCTEQNTVRATHLFGVQGLDHDIAVMTDGNCTQQVLQHASNQGARQDHGAATESQDLRQRVAHRLEEKVTWFQKLLRHLTKGTGSRVQTIDSGKTMDEPRQLSPLTDTHRLCTPNKDT